MSFESIEDLPVCKDCKRRMTPAYTDSRFAWVCVCGHRSGDKRVAPPDQ